MPASTANNLPLKYGWNPKESGWSSDMNLNLQLLAALAHIYVVSDELTSPPGSPTLQSVYIPADGSSGDWLGHDDELAIYTSQGWKFVTPSPGWRARVAGDSQSLEWNGSSWVADSAGLSDAPSDGSTYGRKDGGWAVVSGGSGGTDWAGARVFHVGQGTGMYASIQDAVTAILAGTVPTSTNRAVIMLWPGKYDMTAKVTIPAYTGVKGVSKGLVQLYNNTTDMFQCSDHTWFEDFLIEGAATASLYAFDCNNAQGVHVRRVDMLNNGGTARQKFLKQVGSTWTVLFIEDCIVDYRAISDYAVLLQNSSGAARFCDVNVNDVFFDAYGLTTYGGSFLVRACQDVRFKRSTIRGAATWNTGIRLEKYGATGTPSIEVKHCDMANVQNSAGGVSIYNESGTTVYLTNSDCPGSSFAGTVVNRNSNVT